jgi:hypothetical protein
MVSRSGLCLIEKIGGGIIATLPRRMIGYSYLVGVET